MSSWLRVTLPTALVLAWALVAHAHSHSLESVRINPPVPTNKEPVTLYYEVVESSCGGVRGVNVSRNGETIDLDFDTNSGIISVVCTFGVAVPLGVLPAGDYTIVHSGEIQPAPDLHVTVLDVTTYPISPPGRPLRYLCYFDPLAAMIGHTPHDVTFGDQPGFVDRDGKIRFWPTPTVPGTVDISVETSTERRIVARRAFTFYEGDCETFPESVWEPVLIPVYYNGPGASAQWRTELMLWPSDSAVVIERPWYSHVGAGYLTERMTVDPQGFGNRPAGYLLHVPRGSSDRVRFDLRVRDVARSSSLGAQVPVVRERDWIIGRSTRIENIPRGSGLHATLRLYTLDDDLSYFEVNGKRIVPVRYAPNEPRFASMPLGDGVLEVRIEARPFGVRYWAMVTVNDDRTHDIQILTPPR